MWTVPDGIAISHDLKLSYFDHPSLSYWIVHFSIPLFGSGRGLRLPFVMIFAATTWAVYLLTRQLFGPAAGVWAVVALNLSAFFVAAGSWVLPDGPLLLGLTMAAFFIARGLFPEGKDVSPWRTWLAACFWIGFAGLSKYHAVFFAFGLVVYLAAVPSRRHLLASKAVWAGGALACLMLAPVIIWNAQHHWASFVFQGNRAASSGHFPKVGQFFANLGGQILWLGPWVFVPAVIAGWEAFRRGRANERSFYCLCLGLPAILFFMVIPLWGDRGLPHWQMPGWLMIFPILGDRLARMAAVRSLPRIWATWSAVTIAVLLIVLVGQVDTGFIRLLFPQLLAKKDPTLQALEWTPLRVELKRRGLLDKPGLFIVTTNWIDAGRIDLAFESAFKVQVVGEFQVVGEPKEYAFLVDPASLVGRDALIVGRLDRTVDAETFLAPYFNAIEELPLFSFGRFGMKEVDVRLLYGRVLQKPFPLPYE